MTEKNKIEETEIIIESSDVEVVFNFELEDFNSSPTTKEFGDAGDMSIVYSPNGKRLTLNQESSQKIDNPNFVKIKFYKKGIVFMNADNDSKNAYALKSQGGKRIVYCGPLVKEVIEKFNLDFSNRSCRTFSGARVERNGNLKMLVIELV